MTRYLEISTDLAERVRTRRLRPGSELPAVRVYAAQLDATPSTIARAYRHLADAGIIDLESRRRARVASDGVLAAHRLLHGERVFRLAGSDDPALHTVLARAGRSITLTNTRGSFAGLRALASGEADGAAVHLRHHTGGYNAPYAEALLRDRDPHLLHLWAREQGFIVPPGNPDGIRDVRDLAGRRVAKREPAAGTRVLLDQHLLSAGLDPDRVDGPEFHSHLEIALAVASGIVSTGLAVRSAAAELGLDFISVAWEQYDVILPGDALGAAEPLIRAARDRDVLAGVAAVPGYDLTDSGTVIRLGDLG